MHVYRLQKMRVERAQLVKHCVSSTKVVKKWNMLKWLKRFDNWITSICLLMHLRKSDTTPLSLSLSLHKMIKQISDMHTLRWVKRSAAIKQSAARCDRPDRITGGWAWRRKRTCHTFTVIFSFSTHTLSCWPALSAKLPMMHLPLQHLPACLRYDLSVITMETR